MRNADLFSSNAPNLLKQAAGHALTPSSIYFSAKQGNCDKKQPLVILMQVQLPLVICSSKNLNCTQNFDERKYVQWPVCSSTLSAFMPCWKDVMGRGLI